MGEKMRIGIIDADLLGRKKHRFPNLVCEKLSAYWKEQGAEVELKMDYENFDEYDKIYIAKVFTDTPVPDWLEASDKVEIGGTGFFFDEAPNLPNEIEHHKPDYNLYSPWIRSEVAKAKKEHERIGKTFNEKRFMVQFKEYTDYSIGFTTRGCFRKCPFCVNRKYNSVFAHSRIEEFYSTSRKKICLLDDNILGYPKRMDILKELKQIGKPFKFKQGIDERLLNEELCEILFNSKYDGDFTFAFDNIEDYEIIEQKLKLIRKYTSAINVKFYVLVGFKDTDAKDIEEAFIRIELLMRYRCLPYIMRYQNKNDAPWKNSKYKSLYVTLARWCNQPSFFKKKSFRQYCEANQALHKTKGTYCASMKSMMEYEAEYPEIAKKYFDLRFDSFK